MTEKFSRWDSADYLKTEQPYTTVANQPKYPVPENFRAFMELKIGTDTKPTRCSKPRCKQLNAGNGGS